jgi:GTPase SAR1 family protein
MTEKPPKKRRKESLPKVSSSKAKESRSRVAFESILADWLVTDWPKHDYGIDAMVEITRPIADSDDRIAVSKRFAVQLKARSDKAGADGSFRIQTPVVQIRYWLNSTEPVMVCRYDLRTKRVHYRWIDDELTNELTLRQPAWLSRDSIALKIPQTSLLEKPELESVERHVRSWRQTPRVLLAPGDYFRLKERTHSLRVDLQKATAGIGIESAATQLRAISESIDRSIYTVAITGPSRAGKSTLLNSIVKREISPVGVLPTTGLPVCVVPGAEENASVVFNDGRELVLRPTARALRAYVSQDENPGNSKGVRLITVQLVNQTLERGIALLDVPGLDDPNPEVQRVTATALGIASVVVYVIDASPMRDGGFSLTAHHIEDLKRLSLHADRLFLVLNKVDRLTTKQKALLQAYMARILEQYALRDILPIEPILLSAAEAWSTRSGGASGHDSVQGLEKTIWDYLLQNNKSGILRLSQACVDLRQVADETTALLGARLANATRAEEIRRRLADPQGRLPDIQSQIRDRERVISLNVGRILDSRTESVLAHLRRELDGIHPNAPFPSSRQVQRHLEGQAQRIVAEAVEYLAREVNELTRQVNDWIGKTLLQVTPAGGSAPGVARVGAFGVREFSVPVQEDLSTAILSALGLGLLGLILGPFAGLFAAAVGFLGGFFISAAERKAKKVTRLMESATTAFADIRQEAKRILKSQLLAQTKRVEEVTFDRFRLFSSEVATQIQPLGTALSSNDANRLKARKLELGKLAADANELVESLTAYQY